MKFWLQFAFAAALLAQSPSYVADGIKALDAKQFDTAIELFEKAIATDADDIGAHFNLGLVYSMTGQDARAVPEYRKVLALRPETLEAQVNLGMSLFNTEQYKDAAEIYGAALKVDAKSAASELGLGRALLRLNQLKDAEPHYRQAVNLDAANRDFLLELALAFEQANQTETALSIYQGFHDHPGALEHYGVLLMKQDKLPEAITALEASVKLSPTPANHMALAQAYARKKEPANAELHAAEALKADPSDFDLRMFYGQLLRDQRKFPQAAQQFQTAAETKPESAPAWTELAGVLVMTEQFLAALAALNRVRTLKAESAGHFFLRGLVQDRMKIPKEALVSYQRFLELSQGKNPDQEFQARQRVRTLEKEIKR